MSSPNHERQGFLYGSCPKNGGYRRQFTCYCRQVSPKYSNRLTTQYHYYLCIFADSPTVPSDGYPLSSSFSISSALLPYPPAFSFSYSVSPALLPNFSNLFFHLLVT